MISGRNPSAPSWQRGLASLVLLLAGASACGADSPLPAREQAIFDQLLAALARPAPSRVAFVEQRESALLETPLLLRGALEQPAPGVLVRQVEQPYSERATIRRERVRVERAGEAPREFALRRAPELAGLMASFQAVLAGDGTRLQADYQVTLQSGPERWRIGLQPRAAALRKRVTALELHGRGGELDCLVMLQANGGRSRMLVGPAASGSDFGGRCGAAPEQP